MAKKGFTLIEVITAVIIIGILAAIGTVFFSNTDYNKQKKCADNLRIIANAIESYRETNGDYPPAATLKTALASVPAANFVCPADTVGATDSYSAFYVKRNDYSSMNSFSLGCPRHEGGKAAINVFYQGQVIKKKMMPVDNGATRPGDAISGTATFSDGSTATVTSGSFKLVQSFDTGNGKCYSLISSTAAGDVTCSVTPGSKFEVVTPAAIAGVGGTNFRVIISADKSNTYIGSQDDTVYVENNTGKAQIAGNQMVRATSGAAPRIITTANDTSSIVTDLDTWVRQGNSNKLTPK